MRKQIKVVDLKPGEFLGQDIYNSFGNLLLRRGVLISEDFLKSLQTKGIENVYIDVYEEKEPKLQQKTNKKINEFKQHNLSHQEFNKVYKEIIFELKRTALRGKYNKQLQKELVSSLVDILKIVFATNANNHIDFYFKCKRLQDNNMYTYESHSLNTGILCAMIGQWLSLSMEEVVEVAITGCLHDIGKNRIPNKILDKRSKLNADEWKIMQTHPIIGASILTKTEWVKPKTIIGVLRHHERLDGSGYPYGCPGSDIPLYARIVAVSGAFDTMTSNRPYATAMNPFAAIANLKDQSFGQLDAKITRLLYEKMLVSNIQNKVELANGDRGTIIYLDPANKSKPIVRTDSGYYDLTQKSAPAIKKILKV
ncbi:hypothetical protein SYNTR_1491 [Candidatus Syntrophocurvum alkaliphilum]|uniref:HD-GYP domain-containing protein n=1 Tax=Candidatus Syntrophocurvum alkaliphilum TaxID=2293317 RepID=A0A6I6DKJ7_9FIRM|nr:HD-GYP domain-containing protein [Candidatus Syntrophocurvum alkaliphilum]QGU00085.1 hypothetical protein SYNTR_1491 [Candidatus Syntrophocurvum alkaliphilum]